MNTVRELAEIRDISQKELRYALGVSQSTLSDWMNQKKDPKNENLKKVADYFGVNPMVIKGLAPIPSDYAAKNWDYEELVETPPIREQKQLSAVRFALMGEVEDLTDDEVNDVLEFARFKKSQRK